MITIHWKMFGEEWTTRAVSLSGRALALGVGRRLERPHFELENDRINGEVHHRGQRVGTFKVVYG